MGTVNYKTSDYITMGIKPYDYADFDEDEIKESYGFDSEEDVQACIYDLIQMYYEDDLENAKSVLGRYSFYYYKVNIEFGYYEGFTLNIENNFGYCYDDYEAKLLANKEITQIKKMLIDLAGIGMVACYPFWYTDYEDYEGTLKCIKEAIKEMRAEVKTIPTWSQLYNSKGEEK